MKTIATFATPQEAHNLRAFLEGNGIQAFVRDEDTGASYSMAIGGIKVDVNDADFERATDLYARPPSVDENTIEKEIATSLSPKTETPNKVTAMSNSDPEMAIFRAIVKGIGVYQLITAFEDLYIVVVGKADIIHGTIINSSHAGEYTAFAVFRCCAALLLLYGTDFFCRLAFPPRAPASVNPPAGKEPYRF